MPAIRIALVAPPLLPIPPLRYGGLERVVGVLVGGLHERGHEVTLFGPGDSQVPCRLVPTVPSSLWNDGFHPDPQAHYARTLELVSEAAADFDLIHMHLEQHGFDLARSTPVPVLTTLHGQLTVDPMAAALARYRDVPLIAISEGQRAQAPDNNWIATIHHGLPFDDTAQGDGAGGYLVFVGRLAHEKGVDDAVEVARRSGYRLVIAAKALAPNELEIYRTVVAPAVEEGVVEFVGEVDSDARDELFGNALATIMLSRWPEPFGLVAIESLATGTPVVARRTGALPEIVTDGVDGFVVDDVETAVAAVRRVATLDRSLIRARALARFGADRMVDEYVSVFNEVLNRGVDVAPKTPVHRTL